MKTIRAAMASLARSAIAAVALIVILICVVLLWHFVLGPLLYWSGVMR